MATWPSRSGPGQTSGYTSQRHVAKQVDAAVAGRAHTSGTSAPLSKRQSTMATPPSEAVDASPKEAEALALQGLEQHYLAPRPAAQQAALNAESKRWALQSLVPAATSCATTAVPAAIAGGPHPLPPFCQSKSPQHLPAHLPYSGRGGCFYRPATDLAGILRAVVPCRRPPRARGGSFFSARDFRRIASEMLTRDLSARSRRHCRHNWPLPMPGDDSGHSRRVHPAMRRLASATRRTRARDPATKNRGRIPSMNGHEHPGAGGSEVGPHAEAQSVS